MSSTFVEKFHAELDEIEADAKEHGLNFTSICKKSGISRATPDRWKKRAPKTIALVDTMRKIIEEQKKAIATAIPGEEI